MANFQSRCYYHLLGLKCYRPVHMSKVAAQFKMFILVKLNIVFIERRSVLFARANSFKFESAGIEVQLLC